MPQARIWEEVGRTVVFKKYSQTIERRDYTFPGGRVADYYIRVEKPGVCALALTTDNKIITLPQYRPGPHAILRELPGGQIDENESPHEAAMRELLEETGYTGVMEPWIGKWQSDAYTQADRSVVIVRECKKTAKPHMDETESGEVELIHIADFVAHARTGQLTDTAGALLALDHLGLLGHPL